MACLDFTQQPTGYRHGIPAYMTEAELDALATLAAKVDGRRILEVGSCYGASTATLALAAPHSTVYAVDLFLWSPIIEMPASAGRLADNLAAAGATNVCIIEGDSRAVAQTWTEPLGLLFVDGGHEYEECLADLQAFAPFAGLVAVHDYGCPFTPGVAQAVDEYCAAHDGRVALIVETLAVLAH